MLSPEREEEIRAILQIINGSECYLAAKDLLVEIDRLRTQLDIAVKAIKHVHQYADPEFGWGALLNDAIKQIRGEK